jgi:hypothetical protein
VEFFTNYEGSLYEATIGAVWQIIPEYEIRCKSVSAWEVKTMKGVMRETCTLGSWSGSTNPGTIAAENQMNRAIAYEEHGNGMKCGFLGLGKKTVKGFGSYQFDKSRQWNFCNCIRRGSPELKRIAPDGEIMVSVPVFAGFLTVNPLAMGRQYGWYTSGDEEVIVHSTFEHSIGSSLVFQNLDNDCARDDYMPKNTFREDSGGVSTHVSSVMAQPNTLECCALYRLTNANKFTEFQKPCIAVMATKVDDEVAGVKISTRNQLLCTVMVDFQDDNSSTVLSISVHQSVTIRDADRLRCTTEENHGVNCDVKHAFELFTLEIVNESRQSVVIDNNRIVKSKSGFDLNLGDFGSLLGNIKAPGRRSWTASRKS